MNRKAEGTQAIKPEEGATRDESGPGGSRVGEPRDDPRFAPHGCNKAKAERGLHQYDQGPSEPREREDDQSLPWRAERG